MGFELRVQALRRGQVGPAGPGPCLQGATLLEQGHGRKKFIPVLLGELADKAAPTRLMAHQSLGAEHLQRFAQERA